MVTNLRGQLGKILWELPQFDCQQGETLTDVIVKLSGDSSAVLLLCLNQPATQVSEGHFRPLALGDVQKGDHCANNLLPLALGIGPVFSRKTSSFGVPQHFSVDVDALSGLQCPHNSTCFCRELRADSTRVMNQIVHIPAEEIFDALIPQSAKTGWVAESAAAFEVNSVNGFSCGVEKEPKLILALTQRLLRRPAIGKIDTRSNETGK